MDYLEVKDKINIVSLIILIVLTIIFFKNISEIYLSVESYLIGLGFFKGFLLFSLIVVLAITLTPIPYSPFAVIAAVVFGPWLGMIVSLFSAILGAVTAFLIGRYFLHDFFWKKFKKNKIYRKILESDHKSVLKFIFTSRLMPQTPFDMISYFSGITTIKTYKFAIANLLGMLPIVIILSFFGSQLESYRITLLSILIIGSILYAIFKLMKYKRYYVKGY